MRAPPASSFQGITLGYSRYLRGRMLDILPERDTGALRCAACTHCSEGSSLMECSCLEQQLG